MTQPTHPPTPVGRILNTRNAAAAALADPTDASACELGMALAADYCTVWASTIQALMDQHIASCTETGHVDHVPIHLVGSKAIADLGVLLEALHDHPVPGPVWDAAVRFAHTLSQARA